MKVLGTCFLNMMEKCTSACLCICILQTELCKWTQLQFQGSPVDWKLKPLEKKVVCPPLKPGECGNISITFIAPGECHKLFIH